MSIIERVRTLNLPADEFVVIGSGVLEALGLRLSNDVDIVVSPRLYDELKNLGWAETPRRNYFYLQKDDTEAYLFWDNDSIEPNLAELKQSEMVIDGIAFADPQRLMAWKQRRAEPKDLRDVVLLQQWLSAK